MTGLTSVFRQHEVAHHHVHPAIALRERDPAAETERRRRGHAVDGDLQIAAGNVDLEHVVLEVARPAERLEDRCVVGRHLRRRCLRNGGGGKERQYGNECAHDLDLTTSA